MHNHTCFKAYLYSAGTQNRNCEQGDLFYHWPTQKTAFKTNAVKMKAEDLEKNEVEQTGKVEARTRKNLLAVGKACKTILSKLGRTFDSSGFSTEGTLIFASAVSTAVDIRRKVSLFNVS